MFLSIKAKIMKIKNINSFLQLQAIVGILLFSVACSPKITTATKATTTYNFAQMKDNQFVVNDQPYYFIGTNFWYGAILGSTGQGGDRDRLIRELDFMNANGITNLRVLIGADGENGVPSKVEPTLQLKPGVYNDNIFDGLDFFMAGIWFAASLKRGTDISSWINFLIDKIQQPFSASKRKPKMKVHYGRKQDYDYNANKKAQSDEVDQILDKLKKSGYDSLTTEEKKKLFDASKR
jgi:hypothetical protein